jgi:hypothetical protein
MHNNAPLYETMHVTCTLHSYALYCCTHHPPPSLGVCGLASHVIGAGWGRYNPAHAAPVIGPLPCSRWLLLLLLLLLLLCNYMNAGCVLQIPQL